MTGITTDQGLILPVGTDVNDVVTHLASYTGATGVTSGQTGVESRLVKRYLSATDRTARNPTPATGELSFRIDAAVYEYYTGAVWAPVTAKYPETILKGVNVTNAGNPIATTSGTTEMDLAKLQLTNFNIPMVTGSYYVARFLLTVTNTIASDTFDVRLRANTPVTGTQIGRLDHFANEPTAYSREYAFEFKGDASYTSIYVSLVRTGGTGTMSYYGVTGGQNRTWGTLSLMGDSGNWSDVA